MTEVQQQYRFVLTRVGLVLLIAGVFDVAIMVYCVANGLSYKSSFNLFAIWLGILLMRGNLWAASVVRFFSVFFLASSTGLIAIMALWQPINMTWTVVRHSSPLTIVLPLLFSTLSVWTARELNGEPVLAALQSSGRSSGPLLFPAVLGFGLAAAVGSVIVFASL